MSGSNGSDSLATGRVRRKGDSKNSVLLRRPWDLRIVSALSVVLCAASLTLQPIRAQSSPSPGLTDAGHKAFQQLLTANQFEDLHLGYAGTPSRLVAAFCTLRREPTAGEAFKDLLERATLPGRLYALCGVYFTDPSHFRAAIQEYRHNAQGVPFQSGCILTFPPVSSLVEAARPMVIDPMDPDKSLNDWIDVNHKMSDEWNHRKKKIKSERPPPAYELDILHGGYPAWFDCK